MKKGKEERSVNIRYTEKLIYEIIK